MRKKYCPFIYCTIKKNQGYLSKANKIIRSPMLQLVPMRTRASQAIHPGKKRNFTF